MNIALTSENKKDIGFARSELYRLYQLDWMREHGYGPAAIIRQIEQNLTEAISDSSGDIDSLTDSVEEDFDESGLGGELWCCAGEFLGAEYRDAEYISWLITLAPSNEQTRLSRGYALDSGRDFAG